MSQEFDRIILPYDGSEFSKKAAKKAFFLSKNLGIPIIALHILDQPYYIADPDVVSALDILIHDNAKKYLEEIEKLGIEQKISISTKILKGTPYLKIIEFSKPDDLIILGNKGKTDLKKILLGSVSEKVARHAPCPVMIVR